MQDIAGKQDWRRPTFLIEGRDRTLTCRSLDSLQQSSWPRDIQTLSFGVDGEDGRKIQLYAFADARSRNQVEISGIDALWVQGVAQHYRDALKERRNWHWLANNWLVVVVLAPLASELWVPRLFPHVEVHSGVASRASVLRRRAASAIGILVLIGLSVAGNVLYNLLT